MKKNLLLLIGFLLFFFGFMSIVFAMIGFTFDILAFLNRIGPGFAFLIYILFLIVGLAMMYVAKSSGFDDEKQEI